MARSNLSIHVEGEKALLKALRKLGDARAVNRALTSAADYAMTPVIAAARKRAPDRSGLTKKSLGKKKIKHRKGGGVTIIAGPRTNVSGEVDNKPHIPAKVAHLVEGGHINADGSHTPPHPFLRPAFEESKEEVQNRLRRRLSQNIAREAARATL